MAPERTKHYQQQPSVATPTASTPLSSIVLPVFPFQCLLALTQEVLLALPTPSLLLHELLIVLHSPLPLQLELEGPMNPIH
jgi:hypothetical protein